MNVTRQPSAPDIEWLWRTYAAAGGAAARHQADFPLLWRITHGDWAAIRHAGPVRIGYPPLGSTDQRPTLFGVPVEVVPDSLGAFPELVIVCDRRV